MPTLVHDCPRCATARITFDVRASHGLGTTGTADWQSRFEVFGVCRACSRGTIFVLQLNQYGVVEAVKKPEYWGSAYVLNSHFEVVRFISIRDRAAHEAPEYVPENIAAAFTEGATCLSVECFNASTAMFRLCLDLATKPLLPESSASGPQPNSHQRRNLKPRIEWLIANDQLPDDLGALLDNLREDGNDGAHDGTLSKADAEDALDFASILLQRLFTNPERLRLAEERRKARRDQ